MYTERRRVSEAARTGRLDITKRAAEKIQRIGDAVDIQVGGARGRAKLGTEDCACRGPDRPHVHYFLEGTPIASLRPGAEVDVVVDLDHKWIRVKRATSTS